MMRVRRATGCALVAVAAIVGCGSESDRGTEPVGSTAAGWTEGVNDVAAGSDGRIYVAGPAGLAGLTPEGDWVVFDLGELPAGTGAPFPPRWPAELPGRMIHHVAVGPDGELWLAGQAFSHVDDEEFGGEVNPFFSARFLEWVARGDCDAEPCMWTVFTSDDVPDLGNAPIGDLVVGPDGTAYATIEEHTLLVHDDTGWASHVLAGTDTESLWSESLAVAPDGTLWVGTISGEGLYSFDGTEFTHHTIDDALAGAMELEVSAAPDGVIWVSTDMPTGIASFDGTTWTTHSTTDGLLSDEAAVGAGSDSIVWAVHNSGPDQGYSRYDGTAWTAYPSGQSLGGRPEVAPDGTVWTIVVDPYHTTSVVESWLVAFDGTTETMHPSPFS